MTFSTLLPEEGDLAKMGDVRLFMFTIYPQMPKKARLIILILKALVIFLFFGFFSLFGAPAFGYFPNKINAVRVINGISGYWAYSRPKKPLINSSRADFEYLSNFSNSQSFHEFIIGKNKKKVNKYIQQVIDKPVEYIYDVYIKYCQLSASIGDINMKKDIVIDTKRRELIDRTILKIIAITNCMDMFDERKWCSDMTNGFKFILEDATTELVHNIFDEPEDDDE